MIIKCPACQTKFAVDQALLEAVSRPRFQCSQCGKYFEGSQLEIPPKPASPVLGVLQKSSSFTSSLKPEQLSLLDRRNIPENQALSLKSPIPFPGAAQPSWPEASANSTKIVQVPQPTFKRVELAQPPTAALANPIVEKRLLSSFTDKVAAWPEGNAQPAFAPDNDIADLSEPIASADSLEELPGQQSFKRKIPTRFHSDTTRRINNEDPSRRSSKLWRNDLTTLAAKTLTRAPLAALVLLPVIVFAGLFLWSQDLQSTPQAISTILSLEGTDTLQVPPITGLEVINISSQLIALDDGSRQIEITGDVLNSTIQDFFDIQLEAKTYDANNKVLDTLTAPAANGLTNATEVRSLRRSTIRSLQRKTSMGKHEIKPNASTAFRLMLDSSPQTAWYSVRVYSVGQPS